MPFVDYIDFLRVVTPGTAEESLNQLRRFNMGQIGDVDCPVFEGVYEYCQVSLWLWLSMWCCMSPAHSPSQRQAICTIHFSVANSACLRAKRKECMHTVALPHSCMLSQPFCNMLPLFT